MAERMEVLQLAGYTEQEKIEIAKKFLAPKAIEGAGLTKANITFLDEAFQAIIQRYTREAGVRNLEREISSICRKIARKVVVEGRTFSEEITATKVTEYLGVPRFRPTLAEESNEVGVATGLAWTEVGGEILVIEATLMPGKGRLTLTGKLGDVMQESAQAAMSYVRSKANEYHIPKNFTRTTDVHVHIPEGAIPKDGPSAGITLATALVSALSQVPVRKDVAMVRRTCEAGHSRAWTRARFDRRGRQHARRDLSEPRAERWLGEVPALERIEHGDWRCLRPGRGDARSESARR